MPSVELDISTDEGRNATDFPVLDIEMGSPSKVSSPAPLTNSSNQPTAPGLVQQAAADITVSDAGESQYATW